MKESHDNRRKLDTFSHNRRSILDLTYVPNDSFFGHADDIKAAVVVRTRGNLRKY